MGNYKIVNLQISTFDSFDIYISKIFHRVSNSLFVPLPRNASEYDKPAVYWCHKNTFITVLCIFSACDISILALNARPSNIILYASFYKVHVYKFSNLCQLASSFSRCTVVACFKVYSIFICNTQFRLAEGIYVDKFFGLHLIDLHQNPSNLHDIIFQFCTINPFSNTPILYDR